MLAALLLSSLMCIAPVPRVPSPGPVVVPYSPPSCLRCAGHRGVTFLVPAGTVVTSPAAGTVAFRGEVARRPWVTLRLDSRTLLTVGGLSGAGPGRGDRVDAGDPLGLSTGRVYVGVRRDGLPADPRSVLGSPRARLVAPAGLACPVGAGTPSR